MKISVVTVCLNSARTIRYTIESFLRQTHPDKELLIVDGVSTDETLAIARSYESPDIRILSEKDTGIYDAMNKGLRSYSGDAVGFLNSDDCFCTDNALSLIADALADHDIACGGTEMISDQQSKTVVRQWKAGRFTPSSFRLGWVPPHSGFYVRRKVAEATGNFDTRYRIASDYDFMLRAMMLHDFRVTEIPEYLAYYQLGGASSGSLKNVIRGNLECLDSRRRHLGGWPIDAALFLRPMRRIFQFV